MSEIFSPLSIGTLRCKNRVMMSPMDNGLCKEGGEVTAEAVAFLRDRAWYEVALVLPGGFAVSPEGRATARQMCLYNERLLPGVRRMAEEVHRSGAAFGVQLCHAGRRALPGLAYPPVGPGPLPPGADGAAPHAMDEAARLRVRDDFIRAARHAEALGADMLELDMAGGGLLHSFLPPGQGGAPENHSRFPLEVLAGVAQSVGIPVTVRVSAGEPPPREGDGGALLSLCRAAVAQGAAAVRLTAGSMHNPALLVPPMFADPLFLARQAAALRAGLGVPVMLGGGLHTAALMRQVLEEGAADMIAVGRGLVADQRLLAKIRNGREDEVRPCIRCNEGCLDRVLAGEGLRCSVNPRAGLGTRRGPMPAAAPKNVVVVGGGPGGLTAARTAALRGHHVTLLEAEPVLGGALNVLAALPERSGIAAYGRFLYGQMKRLHVRVLHHTLKTADELAQLAPDAIVVAAGARQGMPPFPVKKGAFMETSEDVLAGRVDTPPSVVVAGGGRIGLYTAKYLCALGRKVHLVEKKSRVDTGLGPSLRQHEMEFLHRHGVEFHLGQEVLAVEPGRVLLDSGEIRADGVVVALGYYPNTGCAQPVRNRYEEVYTIGDAKEPRSILHAVAEGYAAGCTV